MGRGLQRDEYGGKCSVRIKVDGITIDRSFRNRGEAIQWIMHEYNMTKDEIRKRVKFLG